ADPKLSRRAHAAIEDDATEVLVSAVTAWELATKARLGKWPDAARIAADIEAILVANAFQPLSITMRHAKRAGELPSPHRDPFDRMLAAQSEIEGIPLVSADPIFQSLGTRILW